MNRTTRFRLKEMGGLLGILLVFLLVTWPVFQWYRNRMQKWRNASLAQASIPSKKAYQVERMKTLIRVQEEIRAFTPIRPDESTLRDAALTVLSRQKNTAGPKVEADWFLVDQQGRLLLHVAPDQGNMPDPEQSPLLERKSVGNVIRGFSGFSLTAYPGLRGHPVSGVWAWDLERRSGLIREEPFQHLERLEDQAEKAARSRINIFRRLEIILFLLGNLVAALLSVRIMRKRERSHAS